MPSRDAAGPIRAVLLDYGGTLVGGSPDPYPLWLEVLERHGIRIERDRLEAANDRVVAEFGDLQYRILGERPMYWDRAHARALELLGLPDPGGRIVAEIHEAATSPIVRPPFPETERALAALRAEGLTLHVVSNSTDYLVESIERLGWADRFDSVTYSQQAGAPKPDRRIFDLALRRAGVSASEALHVGDTWAADYVGARAAGIRAAWLSREGRAPPEPAPTIRDLTQIRDLLAR